MILTWIMFIVAVSLSSVAAFYSIVGLAAIFAAAVWPIVIMGTILEVAKLTVTVWLHEYWRECRFIMKLYLVPAVVVLMIITSMGIFGFLSKAHIEQAVPAGDVAAQVQLLDERIANERETIANARNLLRQLDDAVIGIQSGSGREIKNRDGSVTVENPAERALQVRRAQARDRVALTATIEQAQQRIVQLQEQRAPIAGQLREVEAKVGPIKYIAALVYGDDPDKNLLERAVRWVIIVLVVVFDPLAIMMLLAATESRKWYLDRRRREEEKDVTDDDVVPAMVPAHDKPMEDLDAALPRSLDTGAVPAESIITDLNKPGPEPVVQSEPEPVVESEPEPEPEPGPEPVVEPEPTDDIPPTGEFHFGPMFPSPANKGDLFLKINTSPTKLFKYNGEKWIEIDKSMTDQYAYNDQYIEFLITEISIGKYDPELLTDLEKEQIESKLKQEI